MNRSYDVIIVGSGSAGSVLAERLSKYSDKSIAVLEAGRYERNLSTSIPIGFVNNFNNPKTNYMYYSAHEPHLNNQSVYQPRGKIVGGSGSINAMIYVRGQRSDFEEWARVTDDEQYNFENVMPFFSKLEGHTNEEHHISVTSTQGNESALCRDFMQSCMDIGYSQVGSFNRGDGSVEGIGFYDMNVSNGIRSSSAKAMLKPALARPNLTLIKHCHVKKINLKGEKPVSLLVEIKGKEEEITINDELILSAGAVGSPHLLQVSGVGCPEELAEAGITPKVALPLVGKNLQDHLCGCLYYQSTTPTLNITMLKPITAIRQGAKYLFQRSGPLAYGVKSVGGFIRSDEAQPEPNVQVYFNPISYSLPTDPGAKLKLSEKSEFSFFYNLCRPASRGHIKAVSPKLSDTPEIFCNFLGDKDDQQDMIEAFKRVNEIAVSGPLGKSVANPEKYSSLSDEEILQVIIQNAGSIYHLCGSCKMGKNAHDSVVDSSFKVHGMNGLRIVDASVFPTITSGNTNAPTMMMAEKASKLILEEWS
ncbi:hypothetical protein TW84_02875 [Vibrio neptunius]|uniref:GMC family oxidoreductase n=1 Tax=Vibrio neptunius TaxID=170651 RepID=UPI0005F9BA10|nr:GMC family oxidoreductase N-terminal domain-containing protein [Vibrio neptunius]KJY93571.1 hypothetical protein TW84_02875 [Vibrio neptunius]